MMIDIVSQSLEILLALRARILEARHLTDIHGKDKKARVIGDQV